MEPASGPATRPSAAYGNACANCVKAKCKCVPRASGNCERCHRLAKDCQPATFIRKRGPRKPSAAGRKSQLEDKLDHLVNLLQAQNPTKPTNNAPTPAPLPIEPVQLPLRSGNSPLEYDNEQSGLPPTPLSEAELSTEKMEQVISLFRTRHLQFLPFIHIPDDMPAENFRQEYPLTFKAICVVCEVSRARQIEIGNSVREELGRLVIVQHERTFDMLLTTLVCMSWQFCFTIGRPGFSMYLSIARSLLNYLRLERPINAIMACPRVTGFPDLTEGGGTRTDVERRVLLSLFALSVLGAVSLKVDPMRWSPQIENSCQQLSQTNIPGDQILVAIARISKVSVEAAGMLQRISEDPDYAVHVLLQIKSLRAMLDQVRSTLTPEQMQSRLVLGYLHSTSVTIHEAALFYPPIPTMSNQSLTFQRIDYLTACVRATKATLENFLAVNFVHLNMANVLAFSHSSQVLYKLSVLEYPGWDRSIVRATADILAIFEQTAYSLKQATEEIEREHGCSGNQFAEGVEKLRELRECWREGLESSINNSTSIDSADSVVDNPTGFEAMDMGWLNLPDDAWFSNFFVQ